MLIVLEDFEPFTCGLHGVVYLFGCSSFLFNTPFFGADPPALSLSLSLSLFLRGHYTEVEETQPTSSGGRDPMTVVQGPSRSQ